MNRSMRLRSCLVVGILFFAPIYPQSLQVSLFGKQVFCLETVQATQKWLASHKESICLVGAIIGCSMLHAMADYYAAKSRSCVAADRKNQNAVDVNNATKVLDQPAVDTNLDTVRSEQAVVEQNNDANGRQANGKTEEVAVVIKRENPITFNGQNINDIIKPGGVLVCEPLEGAHLLSFDMQGGNIRVRSSVFNDNSFVEAELAYVNECKAQRPQMSGKAINMSAGASMNLSGSWMTAQDYISLSGRILLRIEDRLLSCKKIELTGNKMEFGRCYIDTDELIIQTKAVESCCQIIRVTFSKDSSVLKGLHGCIDFANNETYGDCGLRFMGVEKIEIQFAPHAF